MALFEIPLRSDIYNYDFSIDIEGVSYVLELKYNGRASLWMLNIMLSDQTPVLSGIPLLTDTLLTGQHVSNDLFPGLMFLIDQKNEQKNADLDDIGTRILLLYDEA